MSGTSREREDFINIKKEKGREKAKFFVVLYFRITWHCSYTEHGRLISRTSVAPGFRTMVVEVK